MNANENFPLETQREGENVFTPVVNAICLEGMMFKFGLSHLHISYLNYWEKWEHSPTSPLQLSCMCPLFPSQSTQVLTGEVVLKTV